jgi:tRNA(adenine34) deaminase
VSGVFLRNELRRSRRWLGHLRNLHPWLEAGDLAMMRRAIELARQAAAAGEVPVGAVIYRGSEVVAEAANDREASSDPAGHAEMVALRRAGAALGRWRLHDCRMAVTLEPCPMCAGALVNARLAGLVFGAFDAKAGAVGTLYDIPRDPRLNHRLPCAGGVLGPEAAGVLRQFFVLRRKSGPKRPRT